MKAKSMLLFALLWIASSANASSRVETATGPGCRARQSMSAESFLAQTRSGTRSGLGTCPISIFFSGEITAPSAGELKALLDAAVRGVRAGLVLVNLNSEGGDVWEALSLAEHIRAKDYRFVVMNVTADSHCNSSCVFVLAGGMKRIVTGNVGIHRPYFTEQKARSMGYVDVKHAYDSIYEQLVAFFRKVNVSDRLAADMWQVPSHKIKVLTTAELDAYGLSRDDAVLTEMENSDLRTACGDDAPRWREDYFEKVLTPCLDSNSVLSTECVNRRGSRHPYCRCMLEANPRSGYICD
jgi:hypothetical protein